MRLADRLSIECPVFYIDNVVKYSEDSEHTDPIVVLPPFKDMWVEYYTNSLRLAVRIRNYIMSEADRSRLLSECDNEDSKIVTLAAKWLVDMTPYYETKDGKIVRSNLLVWYLDETGNAIAVKGATVKTVETVQQIHRYLYPIWLALGFMHCKNVRHVENIPGGAFERARKRRGEKPSLRYYTLEIDPMCEVLRKEGQSETLGLKQALHICRGHFKDYRQSGLFGKIKGIFWWDAALRGTSEQGVVVKDYAVKITE